MSETTEQDERVEGTVLVNGKRVWALQSGPYVYRDVMCPHRRRYKLAQCGKTVAATFVPD